MQREPKIAWTKGQRSRLNSAVRKYNNAIRRAVRANPVHAEFLPDLVSYSDVKESINSARTLNNTVNRLLRATRKGALNLTSVGDGGISTRYEVREFQIALGRMGTIQQNNLAPDTRTAANFSPVGLRRFIERANALMAQSSYDKLELYYKNYVKGLDTVFGGYSEYDDIISSIAAKIKNMIKDEPGRLMNFFESGDELLNIEYIYSPEARDDKLRYIRDRWAEL